MAFNVLRAASHVCTLHKLKTLAKNLGAIGKRKENQAPPSPPLDNNNNESTHTILTLSVYKVTKVYDYHRKHKTSLGGLEGLIKKQAEGLDDLVSKPTALLLINHKLDLIIYNII